MPAWKLSKGPGIFFCHRPINWGVFPKVMYSHQMTIKSTLLNPRSPPWVESLCRCLYPVLKGIYHYWKYVIFPGDLSKWREAFLKHWIAWQMARLEVDLFSIDTFFVACFFSEKGFPRRGIYESVSHEHFVHY